MAIRETIHSGHFMASNVHENRPEEEEEIDVVSDGGRTIDADTTADTFEKPVTFYKFGPQTTRSIAIDTSLLKLNRCIQTAYAQLITPKWKNFKGLKLLWKERIRLNNVIWRAWHAQFVRRVTPKYCFFSVPEEDWHNQIESAGVMEGIYWKRRMETVCAQYKRWRHFYHKRTMKLSTNGDRRLRSTSMRHSNSEEDALLFPIPSLTPLSCLDEDDWSNWFTDTLFSNLSQPYLFPNPKEMAQAGNADFIQPGLVQLQPSLEEIMASLESDGPFGSDFAGPSFVAGNSHHHNMAAMERMMGNSIPSNDEPNPQTNASNSSHYTSKDYAAASLLVEYSNSMSGHTGGSSASSASSSSTSRSSSAACQTTNFNGTNFGPSSSTSASSTSLTNTRDFRMPNAPNSSTSSSSSNPFANGGAGNDSNISSTGTSTSSTRASSASLCDPYVPQVATIERSTVQYTLAKTWLAGNNANSRSTTVQAGQYDYGDGGGTTSAGPSPGGPYSQMATTIQLLKSDSCLPRSSARRPPPPDVISHKHAGKNLELAGHGEQSIRPVTMGGTRRSSRAQSRSSSIKSVGFVDDDKNEQQHIKAASTPHPHNQERRSSEASISATSSSSSSSSTNMRGGVSVAFAAPTVLGMIGGGHPAAAAPASAAHNPKKRSAQNSPRRGSGDQELQSPTAAKRRASSSAVVEAKHVQQLQQQQQQQHQLMHPFDYHHQQRPSPPGGNDMLLRTPKLSRDSPPNHQSIIEINVGANGATHQSKLCALSPLLIQPYQNHQQIVAQQQQSNLGVLRPIPISLAAGRNDSAFSAISPSGYSPTSTNNNNISLSPLQLQQQQRSPASSNASSVDYAKGFLTSSDQLVNIGPPSQTQFMYNNSDSLSSQPSAQTPVLILQPFGGMQIPIMALPYSNAGAPFPSTIPKQDPDKLPLAPYDPDSYTFASTDVKGAVTSLRPIAQQRSGHTRMNQDETSGQPLAKKTAKRPADSTLDPSERKRVQHLHAEQTRRSALKGGFELLEDLLPEFNSTNTKPTNALVLLKSAERMRELKSAIPNNEMDIAKLKEEIKQMNDKISNYQKQLSVSGKSASKVGMFQQMVENYIKSRTQQSWKFWMIRKILDPMMDSYKTEVQGSSREELLQSAMQWARKRCTKEELRPVVNGFMVQVGVDTPLMKDPGLFRQYVQDQLNK